MSSAGVRVCHCEVEHDSAPVSWWCGPCRIAEQRERRRLRVSFQQADALRALAHLDVLSVPELAGALKTSPAGAAATASSLCRRGWVDRAPAAPVRYRITEDGLTAVEGLL